MNRLLTVISVAWAVLAARAGAARADEAVPVANYAFVVGHNQGGPGQVDLAYAEDDARRMGKVLTELGEYRTDTMDIVVKPTVQQVRDRLAKLTANIAADVAAGRQVRFFFYYSGHARATALDLGSEELPLDELRQRLFAAGATLTVVVLDACQSGAFTRTKGATAAADFSYNSKQQLAATGTAVLASSTASELSQESDQLRSSYFTHHLVVALRGAGDANRDGIVSLDEAYQYAYHQTLLATAVTAVGGQHVSLEVDLVGHGAVPLSFPRAATASIELPAALAGRTLVSDPKAQVVVAELEKARGQAVRIAVAPGAYELIIRDGDRAKRCTVTATSGVAVVAVESCRDEALAGTRAKGPAPVLAPRNVITLEGMIGAEHDSDFTGTLEDFGYREEAFGISSEAVLRWMPPLTYAGARLIVGVHLADAPTWRRDTEREPLTFTWDSWAVTVGPRYELPLGEHVDLYGQIELGVQFATTRFSDQDGMVTREKFTGLFDQLGVGIQLHDVLVPGSILSAGPAYEQSLTIENELGQTHVGGGFRLAGAIGYAF